MSKLSKPKREGVVAIVPARSGSRRLPRKNLLPFHGKPLIKWTLDVAIESGVFDHIVVTSDDELILEEGRKVNTIAINRPLELANDSATTADTILHVLDEIDLLHIFPEEFMLLQPTSPLRSADDIRNALALMNENASDSIISVCKAEHSPLWCGTLGKDKNMGAFLSPEVRDIPSQKLPVYYRLNGAIYIAKIDKFRLQPDFFVRNSHAYEMPANRSVDIDTLDDFNFASSLLSA